MMWWEGLIAVTVALAGLGVREWRRVQLAREQRREREQELLAQLAADIAKAGGRVQVQQRDVDGHWSISSELEERQHRASMQHSPVSARRRQ